MSEAQSPTALVKHFTKHAFIHIAEQLEKCKKEEFPCMLLVLGADGITREERLTKKATVDAWKSSGLHQHGIKYFSSLLTDEGQPPMCIHPMRKPASSSPDPTSSAATISALLQRFDSSTASYKSALSPSTISSYHNQIRNLLNTAIKPSSQPKIQKLVGFALGNPDGNTSSSSSLHQLEQHVPLLTLQELLNNIPCYAQEPAYSNEAKTALRHKGICVLEDPMGILEMDAGTVVVSICPNFPLKEIVADMARSAVLIWIQTVERGREPSRESRSLDPETRKVLDMLFDEYKVWRFPGREETTWNELLMYVRNDLASDSGVGLRQLLGISSGEKEDDDN